MVKLYIVLTKVNSERKKQTVPLIGSHRIQTVSHQQSVFTHTAQVSVTVMILLPQIQYITKQFNSDSIVVSLIATCSHLGETIFYDIATEKS